MTPPTPPLWVQHILLVKDAAGNQIAHCTRWEKGQPMPEVAEANAKLIVTAVNSHAELLAALKAVVEVFRKEAPGTALNSPQYDAIGIQANNAINRAEGRAL